MSIDVVRQSQWRVVHMLVAGAILVKGFLSTTGHNGVVMEVVVSENINYADFRGNALIEWYELVWTETH